MLYCEITLEKGTGNVTSNGDRGGRIGWVGQRRQSLPCPLQQAFYLFENHLLWHSNRPKGGGHRLHVHVKERLVTVHGIFQTPLEDFLSDDVVEVDEI